MKRDKSDALDVTCPRCHAAPHRPCLAVNRPHRARFDAAKAANGGNWITEVFKPLPPEEAAALRKFI